MPIIRDLSKLKAGDEFAFHNSKYKVLACVFQGPFSSVYKLATLDGELFALKLESKGGYRNERTTLKMDVVVLHQLAGHRGFVKVKDVGRNGDWKTLIMQWVGPDLQKLQSLMPEKKFSAPTTYHVLLEVLDRLETLHSANYLHRDLKAANLATGLGNDVRQIFLLDFGMCRRFLDKEGRINIRTRGPICGTIPFASLATNCMEDMGPKDDLENWFFMSLHMLKGYLPWYKSDEDGPHFGQERLMRTREWKKWSLEVDRASLFSGLSPIWKEIQLTISRSHREEPAPIGEVRRLVKKILIEEGIDVEQPLDWQTEPQLIIQLNNAVSKQLVYPSSHGDS